MDEAKQARLKELMQELAALLYEETELEEVKTLEGMEKAVRDHLPEHVGPELGHFLSAQAAAQSEAVNEASPASLADCISEQQGQRLGLKARTQWSPHLERYCLLLSANESYEDAAQDIAVLTGLSVFKSTQPRLVHRQDFPCEAVDGGIKETSIDGGKVRLQTPQGHPTEWRDYKAVNLHQCCFALPDWIPRCSGLRF